MFACNIITCMCIISNKLYLILSYLMEKLWYGKTRLVHIIKCCSHKANSSTFNLLIHLLSEIGLFTLLICFASIIFNEVYI